MKKHFFLVLIYLLFSVALHAQDNFNFKNDSVKILLDKTLLLIHDHALNKDKIDWQALRTDMYQKSYAAENFETVLPYYTYLFEKIGDHHGWVSYKDKNYRWNTKTRATKNETLKNAIHKYQNAEAILLPGKIGYLRIPGNNDFGAAKMDSLANNIADEINTINSRKIKGWIIDLRLNTGGNMYPMIAGLIDLIGNNEKLGGFVTPDNMPDGEWWIRNGNMYIDSNQVLDRKKLGKPVKTGLPLAVLISGYTASSGEMTAISMAGRNETKIFGEESAGYTTTNEGFEIDKYTGLNLATGYVADKTGKIYLDNIQPDVIITGGDNFEDLSKDRKIIAAIKWMKKLKR